MNGHMRISPSDSISPIQAIIDPRFTALLSRSTRYDRGTPESIIKPVLTNTISTTQLNVSSEKQGNKQRFSLPLKLRLQGFLIGLLITGISIAIILSIFLTKSTTTASTITSALSTCDTLQWDPIGITIFGNQSAGSSLYQLNAPRDISIDTDDFIYIADTFNHRVLKIASNFNGTQSATIVAGITGTTTLGSNTLYQPNSIHVDSQKNLYILDSGHYRVQLWTYNASNGSTVAGSPIGASGSTLDRIGFSYGLYVDERSNMYIADSSFARVVRWSFGASNGTCVAGNGSSGSGSSQLLLPLGMVLNSQINTLYITDFSMHTVAAWQIGVTTGTIVAGMNLTQGNTPSLLNSPWDIIRDQYGNFYVSDCANHRIQMFCATQSSFSNGKTIAGIGTLLITAIIVCRNFCASPRFKIDLNWENHVRHFSH